MVIIKRIALVILTFAVMISIMAGCERSTETNVDDGSPKIDELVIYGPNRVLPDDNPTKKWMEEQLGVKLKFITVSDSNEYKTKLNLMITSNDVPDIFTDVDPKEYYSHVSQGIFIDIEPYLRKYAPNVFKYRTEENIDALRWWEDGKLYAISNTVNPGFDMLLLRKDWLDKLSLSVPETLDEFTNVIKAFTENDPDGNGKNDTYGFGCYGSYANFNPIFAAFDANPSQWILKDGKIVCGSVQPELKDAIKYIRSIYKAGYVDKEYLTIDGTKRTEKAGSGKWGVWQDQLWYANETYKPYHSDENTEIICIAPPKGPKGQGYLSFSSPVANAYTGISTSCKDPVTAAKFINFLGDMKNFERIRSGEEGVHFRRLEDGSIESIGKYKEDSNLLIQEGIAPTYAMAFMPEDPINVQKYMYDFLDIRRKYEKDYYAALYGQVPAISEGMVGQGWKDYFDKAINRMIMEETDIDKEFDIMVQTLYDKYDMAEQERLADEFYRQLKKQ